MVFIIKWGSVPVDVNVNVADIDGAAEATSQMEGDIASLGEGVWGGGGLTGVQVEASSSVGALSPGNGASTGEWVTGWWGLVDHLGDFGGGCLQKVLGEVGLHEVSWVEWVDLDDLGGGNGGGGKSKNGGA